MKNKLMLKEWEEFARRVLPPTVSTVQCWEMRRAFYAGAQSILFRVIASLAPESEPTDADLQIMTDLEQELKDFAEQSQTGEGPMEERRIETIIQSIEERVPSAKEQIRSAFSAARENGELLSLSADEVQLLEDFRLWKRTSGIATKVFHWKLR